MYKTNPASRSCLSFFKQPIRKLLVNIGDSSRMVPACIRAGAMFLSLFIILFSGCTSHKPARTREVILIEYRAFCDSLESLPSIPFHRLPEVNRSQVLSRLNSEAFCLMFFSSRKWDGWYDNRYSDHDQTFVCQLFADRCFEMELIMFQKVHFVSVILKCTIISF